MTMRPRFIWPVFIVCVGVIAAAMGWMTRTMLRLERAEAQTVRQSENERLALWRMDSLVVPLVAQESARPPGEYQAFVSATNAYSRVMCPIAPGDVRMPSALLIQDSPYIRVHFQSIAGGELTSPQIPSGSVRGVAESNYTTPERILSCITELEKLNKNANWNVLLEAASQPPVLWTPRSDPDVPAVAGSDGSPETSEPEFANYIEQQLAQGLQAQSRIQSSRSLNELVRRGQTVANNSALVQQQQQQQQPGGAETTDAAPAAAAAVGDQHPMRAVWLADSLLLVRRLTIDEQDVIQGCLLNWDGMRDRLLAEIEDLLPEARLIPVAGDHETDAVRPLMLASLPVRLVPGFAPADALTGVTPMQISLVTAWIGLVLAAVAVALLLAAAMRLSERRGAFVSAVTHELRTPLTTFQLYTEMLSAGMVPTETRRQQYLDTLRSEAARLGHLVENVLSYSRLEGTRARITRERVPIPALLERLEQPLGDRAARDGMEVLIESPLEETLAATGDPSAIERILFNLVDNACKYAAGAADRRIHVGARREGTRVVLRVRDHGAGISRREARRLFRPFSKSATEAAHSAPGVGLGLALCRRLARSMRGDLRIDHAVQDGACLMLLLPAAPDRP
jgi:signal transduction histidine kinase